MESLDPDDSGRAFGMIVGILISLAALFNAVRRIPHPDYERTSVVGMLFGSSGWLLAALGAALGRMTGIPALRIGAFVLAAPLILGGAVFALLGLNAVGMRKGRALSIGALLVTLGFVVVIGLDLLPRAAGDRPALVVPEEWKRKGRRPSIILEDPRKGYALNVPPAPWVEVQPERLHALAEIAFIHEAKRMFFTLSATRLEKSTTPEDLVKTCQDELRGKDAKAIFAEAVAIPAGETPGLLFGTTLRHKGEDLAYRHWVAVSPRFAFLLATWGPKEAEGDVDTLSRQILESFQPLE